MPLTMSIFHLPSCRSLVMMATDSSSISCTYLPSYYTGLVAMLTSHAFRVLWYLYYNFLYTTKNREYSPEFTFHFLFVCVLASEPVCSSYLLHFRCTFPRL